MDKDQDKMNIKLKTKQKAPYQKILFKVMQKSKTYLVN